MWLSFTETNTLLPDFFVLTDIGLVSVRVVLLFLIDGIKRVIDQVEHDRPISWETTVVVPIFSSNSDLKTTLNDLSFARRPW